ncbi:MAG: urease subunit beta [Cyanobacteria bacterium J06626_18]
MSDRDAIPGEILCAADPIQLNADRAVKTLAVANTGDRPIQIGSHFHFFEVNRALQFARSEAYGFRLDIPAGTAVRFEPGDTKQVTLVALGGNRLVQGLNSLVDGALDQPDIRSQALEQLQASGFGWSE